MTECDAPSRGRISSLIAEIDALLSAQVNAIIHHPRFRRLESAWRGLHYLAASVDQLGSEEGAIKIQMLHATWQDLSIDVQSAIEFDQSELFRKIYSSAFDIGGGQPFGLLIGDFEVSRSNDDLATLRGITQVAAAAFSPFVAAAHPNLMGLASFSQLDRGLDLSAVFEQPEYQLWRELRKEDDARFAALTLPRILLRQLYSREHCRDQGFLFEESCGSADQNTHLWGSAAFAFGFSVMRCFADTGWLTDIRGVRRGEDSGGRLSPLVAESFNTDTEGVSTKFWTEMVVTDDAEREMGELGFIPLCHCQDTSFAAFYGNRSIQRPTKYDSPAATANARVSSMLQYTLCVSRFAHHLKVIARDRIGSIQDAAHLEDELVKWVSKYVTSDENASADVKAKYPLRGAKIEVKNAKLPGAFSCVMQLWPHSQMDELVGSLRLMTELSGAPGN